MGEVKATIKVTFTSGQSRSFEASLSEATQKAKDEFKKNNVVEVRINGSLAFKR